MSRVRVPDGVPNNRNGIDTIPLRITIYKEIYLYQGQCEIVLKITERVMVMSNLEFVKTQLDTLPESVLTKVIEFIAFQRYSLDLIDNDDDYLSSIPGMTEIIMEGKSTPLSDCLDNVGWDIN